MYSYIGSVFGSVLCLAKTKFMRIIYMCVYVYIQTSCTLSVCIYVYTFVFCVPKNDSILIKILAHPSCPQIRSYVWVPFNLKRKARLGKLANSVSI